MGGVLVISKKLTNKEFLDRLYNINKNIEIITSYTLSKDKVLCKCKIDNNMWYATPNHLLGGSGCPECWKKNRGKIRSRTHEEFISLMQKINKNIIIISRYVNSRTYIKCKCKIDGCEWLSKSGDLLNKHGCPKCAEVKPLSTKELKERVYKTDKNIEIIGEYLNNKTPVKCKCLIDNLIWDAIPSNLLQGTGCPQCGGTKKKSHEEFISELIYINPNIKIVGEYINNKHKIQCQCLIDSELWWSTPNNLLRGSGCPQCNESQGEKNIREVLYNNNILFETQKEFEYLIGTGGGNLSYDFYLTNHNLLIEYQGRQHSEYIKGLHKSKKDFEKQQEHDKRKREYALNNNIKLLEIWHWDFDDIEEILMKELNLSKVDKKNDKS